MSQYLVRGYKWDVSLPGHDAGGMSNDIYGPGAATAAWAANPPGYPGGDYSEQLVDFSAPDGSGQISNTSTVFLRAGLPGESGRHVTFLGILDPAYVGAHRGGSPRQAFPVSVIAHPSGHVLVEGAGVMTFAPGQLVFQL